MRKQHWLKKQGTTLTDQELRDYLREVRDSGHDILELLNAADVRVAEDVTFKYCKTGDAWRLTHFNVERSRWQPVSEMPKALYAAACVEDDGSVNDSRRVRALEASDPKSTGHAEVRLFAVEVPLSQKALLDAVRQAANRRLRKL